MEIELSGRGKTSSASLQVGDDRRVKKETRVSAYLLGLATLPALAIVIVLAVLSPAAWEWIKPGNTMSGCYLCGKVWRLRKAHTFWHRWVGCRVARGRGARRRITDRWDADERLRRMQETRAAMSAAKGRWKA